MATERMPAPDEATSQRTLLLTLSFAVVLAVTTGVGVGSALLPSISTVVLALALCCGVGLSLFSTLLLVRRLER